MATGLSHPGALDAIEYPRVLELIGRLASSEPGADRVRALSPFTVPEAVNAALAISDEMIGFVMADPGWSPPPIPDVGTALRRLAIEGSILGPEELRALGVLLASSRRCRRELRSGESDMRASLAELAGRLIRAPDVQARLSKSFDEAGQLADGASTELKKLRSDLRSSRRDLVARLERYLDGLPDRTRVADASVTVRSGRYCVPVRREGRSEVGGIIHDESGTHQTLFVEPPMAIQPMNRIRELELAEAREVTRILRDLSDLVRPLADEMRTSLDVLAEVDSLYARARYALSHGGVRPEMFAAADPEEYHIVGARHPLLLAGEEPVVPFDLTVGPEERVILISGPNAGGKTVLLKAIGLISALAQSGIVPPVRPGTRLPVFRRLFAVVGDEQSIEASLSTFSAHVAHLRSILEHADAESLILVDEVGANTDPAEGAALAAAVLLELAGQARLTVATTHLGELKALAEENPRVVNASLQFDAGRLRPSFLLRRDRPGRSYALEIAERLGLPEAVLSAARDRLSGEERALEELLSNLEAREAELERLRGEAGAEGAAAARLREELESRLDDVERRERDLKREGRRGAEAYLLAARKEVEAAIDRLEAEYASLGPDGGTPEQRRAAASTARADVEEALRAARADPMETSESHGAPAATEPPRVGDVVSLRSLEGSGRVIEVRGANIVIETGGVRLTVPISDVRGSPPDDDGSEGRFDPSTASARARSSPDRAISSVPGDRPRLDAVTEVDLRGLRADEVAGVLLPAIDAAVVGALGRLTIIHGKGTGALRQVVGELVRADGRVASSRMGTAKEGGAGVTIIEIQDG